MMGSRYAFVTPLAVLATLAAGPANATITDCGAGDAPAPYSGSTCQSVCVEVGSEVTCSLEPLCPSATHFGAEATAVTGFSATHDVSVWGSCVGGGPRFCCVFDEGATNVDTLTLVGTDDPDEVLGFRHVDPQGNERALRPWDADRIDGFIRGAKGGDYIEGSSYSGSNYRDHLYGERGDDVITGNAGSDFLSGGDGDDRLDGGAHDDTLWGGDGDDWHFGGNGHDALCDASGYHVCATDGGNTFDGGLGNDILWYEESENPSVPCPNTFLDPASTAGPGLDECGDHSDYGPADLASSCDSLVTVEPGECVGAS